MDTPTSYDDLLTHGYTDREAARYMQVPVPVAQEGMRRARIKRDAAAEGESNYRAEVLEKWGLSGVP